MTIIVNEVIIDDNVGARSREIDANHTISSDIIILDNIVVGIMEFNATPIVRNIIIDNTIIITASSIEIDTNIRIIHNIVISNAIVTGNIEMNTNPIIRNIVIHDCIVAGTP